jgi:hypothetical protein
MKTCLAVLVIVMRTEGLNGKEAHRGIWNAPKR